MKKRKDLFKTFLFMMFALLVVLVAPMTAKAGGIAKHDWDYCENTDCEHVCLVSFNVESGMSYALDSKTGRGFNIDVSKFADEVCRGCIYYLSNSDNLYHLCHGCKEEWRYTSSLDKDLYGCCNGNCGNNPCSEEKLLCTVSRKIEDHLTYGNTYSIYDVICVYSQYSEYSLDKFKERLQFVNSETGEEFDEINQVGRYSIKDKDTGFELFPIYLAYDVTTYNVDGSPLGTVSDITGSLSFSAEEFCYDGNLENIYISTDPEGNNRYELGDTIEFNDNINLYLHYKDVAENDHAVILNASNNSNNSQPAKEEVEKVEETPVVTRTYAATENTTEESWNKAYVSDGNGSHGNLGNHYKSVAPASISNNSVSGWDSIKTDIASKTDEELNMTAYEVNMNTSTRVDNSTLDLLSSKELPYARFKIENNTTFVLPTNLSAKNTETFSSASDNKAKFYIDITCNTTNDVNNKVIDTQFVPANLIKSVNGNDNTRIITVRTNNQDLTNIGAVKIARTDESKTKVSLYLYDKANNTLKPCGSYDYDANGMAVVYVSLANWNLVAVEE